MADSTSRFASYFSRLNPVPVFPPYTGPYKVGTIDVEIPVAELTSPCPTPDNDIPTILFRVFYPAVDESHEKPITWLPSPQRQYVSAYTKFMGMGHALSELVSFLPRHLYYASIPVHKNAVLRPPSDRAPDRWPTMLFSHGLGGCRNSYSYLVGSLASHGVVVFCPEHRDGSAIASFIRVGQDGHTARKMVPYASMPHEGSSEVYSAREAQLRIRLWEMALTLDAVLAMNSARSLTNLDTSTAGASLQQFAGTLNLDPGSVIFGGHSFGATTVYQLLKSTYYAHDPRVAAAMADPLFIPVEGCGIARQVTEKTVTMLLDMWCLPLLGPNSAALFNLPLPLYADVATAKGGTALLVVESDAFYKWTQHLNVKARLLSPDPTAEVVSAGAFLRPGGKRLPEPNFFYVVESAHLSQSDFGILFPWLTKRIFNAVQPERALRLNLRAQLQLLRVNGISVARTFVGDLIDGAHVDKLDDDAADCAFNDGLMDDAAIFYRSDAVDSWRWVDMIGLGELHEGEKGKELEVAVVP